MTESLQRTPQSLSINQTSRKINKQKEFPLLHVNAESTLAQIHKQVWRLLGSWERRQWNRLPALPMVLGCLGWRSISEVRPFDLTLLTSPNVYLQVTWTLTARVPLPCLMTSQLHVPWTVSLYSARSAPSSDLRTLSGSTHGNPYSNPRRLESPSPFQRWRNWGTGHIYFTVWHFVLEHRIKCQTVK